MVILGGRVFLMSEVPLYGWEHWSTLGAVHFLDLQGLLPPVGT